MITTSQPQLCFFNRSKRVAPGKGVHEKGEPFLFPYLGDDFREVLSNFHVSKFTDDLSAILIEPLNADTAWNTIEHAFQGAKFCYLAELAEPKRKAELRRAGLRFTHNSGDPIGQGEGKDAQKNRKLVKLSPAELQQWEVVRGHVLEVISKPAYEQCPARMRVLLNTGDARLLHLHTQRGKPSALVPFLHLEAIRDAKRMKV